MGRDTASRAASQASQPQSDASTSKQKRQASIYDAVAGRVSSMGFIREAPLVSKNRDTPSSSTLPIPPEEVLFRRSKAPERFEEDDYYWEDRHLTEKQKLPDSDLLKAIHTYASDFYSRATPDAGQVDFSSMDGSALLALGILLEEAAEHLLGATGDMVFVEAKREDGEKAPIDLSGYQRRVIETSAAAQKSADTRRGKRRKIHHVSNDTE